LSDSTATATIQHPGFTASASVIRPDATSTAISLCTRNMALSQFCYFDFDSFAVLDDGRVFGAMGDYGVMALDGSDTDDSALIAAKARTGLTDFGAVNQKRIRSIYFGGEATGDITLSTRNDEGNEREYTFTPENTGGTQQSAKLFGGRDGKGRYWDFQVENVDGCDFGIDQIDIVAIVLGRKPSGS
jgi:hypothetical protein